MEYGELRRTAIHADAILASAVGDGSVVTGGDDGKVISTRRAGVSMIEAQDPRGRWIDCVATGPNGAIAWSAGKQAFARARDGAVRTIDAPSTVGGLAFAPKGFRLALAHYNGVTLWFPNSEVKPEVLIWKGSHLGVMFSTDARFVITRLQEPGLHAWRLSDGKAMRMSGYASRVRAASWSSDGRCFASSWAT